MGIEIQWPLVLFTLFSGIGGGLLVPAGIAELTGKRNDKAQFAALIASLVLLVVGGCFSLLHLAAPQNVMAAVYNIFSFSGISIELILLGLSCIAALVFLIMLKRGVAPTGMKAIGAIAIVVAVLLMYFCGHGYIMVSRPAWDTEMLPIAYLGTSLAGGVFAYGVILAACKADESICKAFRPIALGGSIVCACTCALYSIAVCGSAGESALLAFWGGLVLCGIVAMFVIGVASYLKLSPESIMVLTLIGLAVAVIAILAVRIVMWETSEGYLEFFNLAATVSPYVSIIP